MHHINNAINMMEISGRVLSLFAVFMLAMLGGTYAHAAESFHSHHQLTENDPTLFLPAHAHLNGDDTATKKNTDIHCGGEILISPKPQETRCKQPFSKLVYARDQRLTGISKSLDPPPPRLFSKLI